VYDVVDEKQYRVIVRNRRKQEDFVVDDDGTGYYDDGEEHLFEAEDGGEDGGENGSKKLSHPKFRNQSLSSSKKGGSKKGGALSAAAMQKAREAQREKLSAGSAGTRNIGAMFLGIKSKKTDQKRHSSSSSSSTLGAPTSTAINAEFDLNSMLDDLVDGPQGRKF
jgi:DNA polymerase alpha subunit A